MVAQTLQSLGTQEQMLALQEKDSEIRQLQQQLALANNETAMAKSQALRATTRLNFLANSVTQYPK